MPPGTITKVAILTTLLWHTRVVGEWILLAWFTVNMLYYADL